MNILTNQFPTKINGCKVNTDFRVMIQYEKLIRNNKLSEEQKIEEILDLFYIDKPKNIEKAIKGLNWFYRCGDTKQANQSSGSNAVAYDFEQDDYLIVAAFYQVYHIDLEVETMHWWKFSALLVALPKDTLFMEIVGYRIVDTKDMPKKMKAFYKRQKEKYAIKIDKPKMTLQEREDAFQKELDRKYYAAIKQLELQQNKGV